jgi:hypothetical protein
VGLLVVLFTFVSALQSITYAQVAAPPSDKPPVLGAGLLRKASLDTGRLNLNVPEDRRSLKARGSTQVRSRSRRSAVGWGILGGVVAGVAVAAAGASAYGENERGGFCSRCFVTWSAVTIPVGAGVGALAGYLVDVARR